MSVGTLQPLAISYIMHYLLYNYIISLLVIVTGIVGISSHLGQLSAIGQMIAGQLCGNECNTELVNMIC